MIKRLVNGIASCLWMGVVQLIGVNSAKKDGASAGDFFNHHAEPFEMKLGIWLIGHVCSLEIRIDLLIIL